MKFLRITTTLLLLLMFAVIHALEPGKATYQYHLDTWKRERGLPENTITCIKQTGKGYIWLGTPMGLVRFDGVHFKLYDKKTVPAFLNNFVRTIHEDHDGNLWIGTEGGLLKFEKGRFTPFTLGEKKADNFVMTICETPGGSLWIGTLSGSVYCFQKGEFTRYSSKSGLSGGAVRCLHFSRTGILRAGTANGLYRYRDGKFVSSPLAKEISADYITCIYEDVEKKQLWIGTTEGLNRVNEESGKVKIYTAAQGLTGNIVLDIYRDRDDNLWLGTEGGLCRITGDVLTAFSGPQSLPRNVYSISEDTEGGLWLGTLGGGLFRLRDVPITAYTTSGGLSHNMVSGIIEDNRNNIWLGTAGGLNRFTDGAFYQYTIKDGLSDNSISSLRMDSSGRLWIGTRKGLNRFSNGAFVSYTTRNGLSDDKITAILEDSAKTFWIGTYEGGLNRFKEGEFTSYTAPQHLLHNRVRCMMEDSSGYLWVGTYGGLTRLKNNSPKHYTDIDGLPDNKINCIYQDRKGILWIGTRSGPCRLKDGVITSIVTGDEFFSNSISAILEDNLGYTWMSSDKGLCRARRKQLNDFADGISDVIDTLCFTEEDGMKSSVCNGSAQPSAFKSKDGRLWFPTLKGVAMVDPAHLSRRRKSPPLVLEEILINGDLFRGPESEEDASAVFPPGVKKFEFHYTALSFINPEKIVFKYRLEGYDEDWVAVGNRRAAYYTNLNPGNYTFRVTASIDGKTWNTQPEAFRFHLEPYFFQTSWFLILCLVAALIPGTIFYRWRISKFEKRKRELEELVDERTRLLKIANRKLSETNSELKRIASMDGLTGIHNYRWFSEYLDLEWRRAYRAQKTITVILIDLDCFRQYNENYGHDTGDETLKKIARKLKSLCRRPGDVVARYGGEEFIAVFAETPSDQVVAPAGRILKGISDLNILHETSPIAPHVTASLGCATTVPGRTDSPDELIKIAHNALNQAKKDGKNRFIARKV